MGEDLQNLIERYNRAHDSRLFAPLADAYRKRGEVEKAIEILEKGLEKFPGYASAHVILGKCYYDKGATARAKAEFLRVIEIDGENMVALKFMGDIFLAEDKRAEAADYYRKVIAIDPMNEEVARALKEMETSFVLKEINLADAKSARDERPRELATMTLAGIYAAQGYYNKALGIYREVLEREPENREAQEMTAKLESIMNSTEAERDKAFQEEVLTISLEDVSEGLVSSTAGHGGEGNGEAFTPETAAEPAADEAVPAERSSPGDSPPQRSEEPSPSPGDAPREILADRDMENFRDWLKRLKGK